MYKYNTSEKLALDRKIRKELKSKAKFNRKFFENLHKKYIFMYISCPNQIVFQMLAILKKL